MQRSILFILFIVLSFATTVLAQDNEASTFPEDWLSLDSSGQDAAAVLEELELDGMIPSGAEEVFRQSNLNYAGEGAEFATFGVGSNAVNLLYSAIVDFSPQSADLEYCGIAARVQREETSRDEDNRSFASVRITNYLLIGLDNRGNLFVADNQSDESSLELAELPEDASFPMQITALLLNDLLYVYGNDDLLIQGLEVQSSNGDFAFLYSSQNEDTSCNGTLLFAYSFPDELPTACVISTPDVANKRQSASVDSRVMGQLTNSEPAIAVGQILGADGFIWWRLTDESYVRSDVVQAAGFCRNLPDLAAS